MKKSTLRDVKIIEVLTRSNSPKEQKLFEAVALQDVDKVKKILQEGGVNIDAQNARGDTPLSCACDMIVNPKIAMLLIENGANVNILNALGESPLGLRLEIYDDRDVLVAKLKECGAVGNAEINNEQIAANFGISDIEQKLFLSLLIQDLEEAKKLLDAGVQDIMNTKNNITLIHCVRDVDHIKTLEFLLSNGIDPNRSDMDGTNALHLVAEERNNEGVILLINHGVVDVNAKNIYGETALHLAITNYCSKEAIKALLDAGVDIDAADIDDFTAIDYALNLARSSGQVVDEDENVLFSYKSGELEYMYQMLVEHGAELTDENKKQIQRFTKEKEFHSSLQEENSKIAESLDVKDDQNSDLEAVGEVPEEVDAV